VRSTSIVIKNNNVFGVCGCRSELLHLPKKVGSSLREVISVGCEWSAWNRSFRKYLRTFGRAEVTIPKCQHCTTSTQQRLLDSKEHRVECRGRIQAVILAEEQSSCGYFPIILLRWNRLKGEPSCRKSVWVDALGQSVTFTTAPDTFIDSSTLGDGAIGEK
jgi:hypothetical protein